MSEGNRRFFLILLLGISIGALALGGTPATPLDVTYYYLPG